MSQPLHHVITFIISYLVFGAFVSGAIYGDERKKPNPDFNRIFTLALLWPFFIVIGAGCVMFWCGAVIADTLAWMFN